MSKLSATLDDQGQLKEASKTKEVLEKIRRILGEGHPDTITAINNLANALGDQEQLEKAMWIKLAESSKDGEA
jgi:Tetratricopeptide repeat